MVAFVNPPATSAVRMFFVIDVGPDPASIAVVAVVAWLVPSEDDFAGALQATATVPMARERSAPPRRTPRRVRRDVLRRTMGEGRSRNRAMNS